MEATEDKIQPGLRDKEEVPFTFDELLFSRTDSKGLIQAGNSVFQRVSLYNWEELYKKPHNRIRHQDMPKGVFYLFWNFLKNGKPIGAYVKNRAKDGRHYWVYAIATPIEGGYLSVRLKPSSDFFPIVQDVYKSLLATEYDGKVTPEDSANILLEKLKSLGFGSYEEFMSTTLNKELASRAKNLSQAPGALVESFAELTGNAHELMGITNKIFSSFEENKYVPLNLRIQSSQLGEEGRTIGVISGNYNIVSTEIKEEINKFNKSAREVFDHIFEGQFLACTSRIQGEVIDFFRNEQTADPAGRDLEMSYLKEQQGFYQQKALEGLNSIINKIKFFQEDTKRMKMCSSSLEVIRIMGKVDAARLSTSSSGLNELLNDLKLFQESIANNLAQIDIINSGMRYEAQSVVAELA